MKHLVAVTGAVLAWAVLATGGIQAQDADRKDPAVSNSLFERLDTNKDGKVTKDELPEDRQRLFERLVRTADKNGDGQLTADEFAAGVQDRPPGDASAGEPDERRPAPGDGSRGGFLPGAFTVLRALDADNDGKLSKSEIEGATAALKKLDKNNDGELTREELQPSGGTGGFAGRLGGGTEPAAMGERLRGMDKNNDGKFSKDELPPLLQERFDALDANKDGALEISELRAFRPVSLGDRKRRERSKEEKEKQ